MKISNFSSRKRFFLKLSDLREDEDLNLDQNNSPDEVLKAYYVLKCYDITDTDIQPF